MACPATHQPDVVVILYASNLRALPYNNIILFPYFTRITFLSIHCIYFKYQIPSIKCVLLSCLYILVYIHIPCRTHHIYGHQLHCIMQRRICWRIDKLLLQCIRKLGARGITTCMHTLVIIELYSLLHQVYCIKSNAIVIIMNKSLLYCIYLCDTVFPFFFCIQNFFLI